MLTVPAIRLCLAEQIQVVLLSEGGRFIAASTASTRRGGTARAQFQRAADPAFCLRLAKALVGGKIANSRLVLRRYARNRPSPELEDIETAIRDLPARHSRPGRWTSCAATKAPRRSGISKRSGSCCRRMGIPRAKPPAAGRPGERTAVLRLRAALPQRARAAARRGLNPHVGFLHPPRTGHPAWSRI